MLFEPENFSTWLHNVIYSNVIVHGTKFPSGCYNHNFSSKSVITIMEKSEIDY